MNLQFESFTVSKIKYGDDAGKLRGKIEFVDEKKKVEFHLSPEVLEKIVEACAEEMYAGAIEVAEELKDQMLEWVAVHALPEKRNDGAVV